MRVADEWMRGGLNRDKRTSDGMVRADGVEGRMDCSKRVAVSVLEISEERRQ